MENYVYTSRVGEDVAAYYAENAERLVEQGYDPEATPMRFKNKHLPHADKSSGIVRFRTVTPKQRFTDSPEAMDEISKAAWRHREIAADHIAAALWLSTSVPVDAAPKPRKQLSEKRQVTVPLDHVLVTAGDFNTARAVAGVYKGNFAADVAYFGAVGSAGDGRTMHQFEVTYEWSEVEK